METGEKPADKPKVREATLECCDLCGETIPMREVVWTGVQTLCPKCIKQ